MHRTIRTYFFTALFILAGICVSFGGVSGNADKFFSYERLFLNQTIISEIPGDSKTQRDVKAFAHSYTDGIYELSADNLEKAEEDLLRARSIWAEHYGPDFLLGLVYERKGDYKTAARYYKSYLNKLRDFQTGAYRMSSPLIRSLAYFEIEDYNEAHALVKEHMALYGINIDRVRPASTYPAFVIGILVIVAVTGVFLFFSRVILPYMKRQYEVNNPPEGYWVCRHCGADNPELAVECEECRRPREG